jgi:hypothetical protein
MSETRVPNFFLGLPTGALGSFLTDFFFGGICFLHIYTNEKKIGRYRRLFALSPSAHSTADKAASDKARTLRACQSS